MYQHPTKGRAIWCAVFLRMSYSFAVCRCNAVVLCGRAAVAKNDLVATLSYLSLWFADVFNKPLSSCCPTKYLLSCCPYPVTEPCNASVTVRPPKPPLGVGGKPFCMKPQNSTACEAGFYLNNVTKKVEPCPDGKAAFCLSFVPIL